MRIKLMQRDYEIFQFLSGETRWFFFTQIQVPGIRKIGLIIHVPGD